jgi:hypothetical protein
MLTLWLFVQHYLSAVALDGDYHNDWLTHLPLAYVEPAIRLAHLLYGR